MRNKFRIGKICFNGSDDSGTQRYILGGSWADPTYTFREGDLRSPWDRSFLNGIRCVVYSREGEQAPEALFASRPPFSPRDIYRVEPLADRELNDLLAYYAYDRTPLNSIVEPMDDSSLIWRKEKITFDAAYGGERITAYLFLPKTGRPPYQTVVYFPGGEPLYKRTFEDLPYKIDPSQRTSPAFSHIQRNLQSSTDSLRRLERGKLSSKTYDVQGLDHPNGQRFESIYRLCPNARRHRS